MARSNADAFVQSLPSSRACTPASALQATVAMVARRASCDGSLSHGAGFPGYASPFLLYPLLPSRVASPPS